jgi:hypothetical protein
MKTSALFCAMLFGLVVSVCGEEEGSEACVGRGCGGDVDGGGGDADSDSDTDTAPDTDTDTFSENHVECEDVPSDCVEISEIEEEQYFGCCRDGVVYWCDDGQLDSIDCESQGLDCGYDEGQGFMDCV